MKRIENNKIAKIAIAFNNDLDPPLDNPIDISAEYDVLAEEVNSHAKLIDPFADMNSLKDVWGFMKEAELEVGKDCWHKHYGNWDMWYNAFIGKKYTQSQAFCDVIRNKVPMTTSEIADAMLELWKITGNNKDNIKKENLVREVKKFIDPLIMLGVMEKIEDRKYVLI